MRPPRASFARPGKPEQPLNISQINALFQRRPIGGDAPKSELRPPHSSGSGWAPKGKQKASGQSRQIKLKRRPRCRTRPAANQAASDCWKPLKTLPVCYEAV